MLLTVWMVIRSLGEGSLDQGLGRLRFLHFAICSRWLISESCLLNISWSSSPKPIFFFCSNDEDMTKSPHIRPDWMDGWMDG